MRGEGFLLLPPGEVGESVSPNRVRVERLGATRNGSQETETVRFKVTPGNSIFCVRFSPGRIRIIT
jgi:hypothetical protein